MKELHTERLILRAVRESDAPAIFKYSASPNVGPRAGWKPHESLEETQELMKAVFLEQESVWAMILADSQTLIGTAGLVPDPKRENDRARMLGYSIGENWWGLGYTTEAAKAIIHHGFSEMELSLISAYCYPGNERSKKVISKCGFAYEGCLKMAAVRYDGKVLDEECYILMAPEAADSGVESHAE